MSPPAKTDDGRNVVLGIAVAFAVAFFAGLVLVGRGGSELAARIKNPSVTGHPRPVEPLFGFDNWVTLHQIGTVVMMITIVVVFAWAWRRRPGHPILLMVIVTTLLIWQDPIMNWAPIATYNPKIFHWPETWGLFSISPTVEPFLVVGYASFQMAAYFPGIWFLRKLQARRPTTSFVWKHPLVTLGGLILAIGFVFDAFLETFLVRTQLYSYSQVVPFGSIFKGKSYQFPLLVESSLVTLVMIAAGVLLYRDDTGKTQAEKLASRARVFARKPVLGTFVVMFVIVNVAYFAYGGAFAVLRAAKLDTSVACPWPFPEVKVYDPQGFYEKNGQPGPYFDGIWNGWQTAQSGRPDNVKRTSNRCVP